MFYPEISCTLFPVLRADNVEKAIKESFLDTGVKDGKELGSDLYHRTPQPREKGWL